MKRIAIALTMSTFIRHLRTLSRIQSRNLWTHLTALPSPTTGCLSPLAGIANLEMPKGNLVVSE